MIRAILAFVMFLATPVNTYAAFDGDFLSYNCGTAVNSVHPNHFSTAEVRWNSATGNFEIALCVYPLDLEKALSVLADKSVSLDQKEGLDELMKRYIESRFFIRKARETSDKQDEAFKLSLTLKPDSKKLHASAAPGQAAPDISKKFPESISELRKVPPNLHSHRDIVGSEKSDQGASRHSAKAFANERSEVGNVKPNEEKIEARSEIRWVGFEANAKEAWLYFEIPGDVKPAKWEIENRVFFEFNEEQVNQIRFSSAHQIRSFSLKQNRPMWRIDTFSNEEDNLSRLRIR